MRSEGEGNPCAKRDAFKAAVLHLRWSVELALVLLTLALLIDWIGKEHGLVKPCVPWLYSQAVLK